MPSLQFNLKDPTTISILTLICSFVFFLLVLYLLKPKFIQIIDKNGKSYISNKLIVSFSSTFSLVAAITSLILVSTRYSQEEQSSIKNSSHRVNKVISNFSL